VFSVTIVQSRPTSQSPTAERDRTTVELLRTATTAGKARRAALIDEAVTLNLDLARHLANKYFGRGIASDDLQQVACLGLIKAARGFAPDKSDSFAAYAIPTIRGELRRHFRDTGWTVRPPRRIQELQARIRSVEADLVQELHRSPTVKELAEAVGAELDDVLEATAVDSCFNPLSLDAPTGDSTQTLGETIKDLGESFTESEARLLLGPAVRRLGDRDRRVIELRFFQGRTQQEIGEDLGVSQMQVSRILTRVLAQLRGELLGAAA
jgi:RNA polymerase sigma-B factor